MPMHSVQELNVGTVSYRLLMALAKKAIPFKLKHPLQNMLRGNFPYKHTPKVFIFYEIHGDLNEISWYPGEIFRDTCA